MELKSYQKKAIEDLTSYLEYLEKNDNLEKAWNEYWKQKGVNGGRYNNKIKNVPNICIKVPTGGGKTFIACASIKPISDAVIKAEKTFVIWLVPSEAILSQTLANLKNPNHPYREKLNAKFNSEVEIFSSNDLLSKLNNSNLKSLNIAVLTFASIRINNKEMRKMYQENGALLDLSSFIKDDNNLDDIDRLSVINLIRNFEPLVIVDESHNAKSNLSLEMLENLNPSFIYELSATPKDSSNIIHYTNPIELKKENMVKLPVFLCNLPNVESVITNAVIMRDRLESIAKEENENIRPIVLFQAQSGANEDIQNFEKLKNKLIKDGIDEKQIAIKTAKINDLEGKDLLDKDCQIRYIITINALKEGWDCPYAYILASIANKNSTTDVEQLIGRVLRQPKAKQYNNQELNVSYVLTCSNNFENTAKSVVSGLNGAGFSKDDYRQQDFVEIDEVEIKAQAQAPASKELFDDNPNDENSEFLNSDIDLNKAREKAMSNNKIEILENAKEQANKYNESMADSPADDEFFGDNIKIDKSDKNFETHKLPQFVLPEPSLLDDNDYKVLEKEDLDKDFNLADKDTKINFELADSSIYQIDIDSKDNLPKYLKASQRQREYFKEYLKSASDDTRNRQCINTIAGKLNKKYDVLDTKDLQNYTERIINNLTDEQKAKLPDELDSYAIKISSKIDDLIKIHRENKFNDLINKGTIRIKEIYEFPAKIQSAKLSALRPKSLYKEEIDNLNSLESKVLTEIASCDNVKWWHRNKDNKPGFCINAFINHYPDFIIYTEKGNIIAVETKGDDRTNDDSKIKLKIGNKWADKAGDKYFYFMVFEKSEIEGSLLVDQFINTLKEL